uniref:C-type lectin domain-containing protein n=1 Tax=Denticeps clupeoides TaxID=299321 RepID=A0AAY4C0H2_9TELE
MQCLNCKATVFSFHLCKDAVTAEGYGKQFRKERENYESICLYPNGSRETHISSDRTKLPLTSRNNVYVPVFTPMPWSQARQYCRSNYTDLATIPSSTAQQEMFSLTPAMAYWIGLFRDAWEWANGDQSTFRQWATVPPSNVSVEACAAVDMNGLWHSLSCSSYLPFICQMGEL